VRQPDPTAGSEWAGVPADVLEDVSDARLDLACHAALPVAVDTAFLHLLRVNFFLDVRALPFEAEADLLLSPVFRDIGDGLFEIEPGVRDRLLDRLRTRFSDDRAREIAHLLWQYVEGGGAWRGHPELEKAQQLTALHILAPEKAAVWLAESQAAAGSERSLSRDWFVAMRRQLERQPPPGRDTPAPGRLVANRYRLVEHGPTADGPSTAWRAVDERTGDDVAANEWPVPGRLPGPETSAWPDRAAQAVRRRARLPAHPQILHILRVAVEDGRLWVVTDPPPARSLGDVVRLGGPLDPSAAARLGLTVLDALAWAHRHDTPHGAVNPDTILIRDDGRAVLGGFDAAAVHALGDAPPAESPPGRPAEHEPATATSDLRGLGAALSYALAGRPAPADGIPATGPLHQVIARLMQAGLSPGLNLQEATRMLSTLVGSEALSADSRDRFMRPLREPSPPQQPSEPAQDEAPKGLRTPERPDRLYGGDPTPYFFLSYGRIPQHDPGEGDPDRWIVKFYRDLCQHVMQLTDASTAAEAGFMDREWRPGSNWPHRLANALATCRVFVPLYSHRYFASEQCGREWFAFSQRVRDHEARGGKHAEAIIPALWVPVPASTLPESARMIQFDHSTLGSRYAERGFYGLIKLRRYRADYEEAVYELARRIVVVAQHNAVDPARPADYESLHSAFGSPGRTRAGGGRFRVTVVAPDTTSLPDGRSPYHYGRTPLDWNPYRPDSQRPLAELAADIVSDLDYRADVGTLDDHGDLLADEPPTSPGVLLVDVWATVTPEYRDLLRRVAEIDNPWIQVMIPWNRLDAETAAAEPTLRRSLEEALHRKLEQGRPVSRTAVSGIPSLEQFGTDLPKMVLAAAREYYKRAPITPSFVSGKPDTWPALQGETPDRK
jgi:FxsC-like protein